MNPNTLQNLGPQVAREARRRALRQQFTDAVVEWARARGGVELPRDTLAIIALGVPCDDCLTAVKTYGGVHRFRFDDYQGIGEGAHWSETISARCGREPQD
jgi:hypothetical protein